jgi:cell division septum initiation protein DivIVA
MSDVPLDADEIARRGEEIRSRLRARLEAAQHAIGSEEAAGGVAIDTDPELIAAVREANRALLHEIGRVAEEVLADAEEEANRLLLAAHAEAEAIKARAEGGRY